MQRAAEVGILTQSKFYAARQDVRSCCVWRGSVCWLTMAAHIGGSDACFNMLSYLFGTLVNLSTRFFSDVVSLTSTTKLYSSISCCKFGNLLRISLAVFVLTWVLPLIHAYAESVYWCTTFWSASLMLDLSS